MPKRKRGKKPSKYVVNNIQSVTNESQYNYADDVASSSANMVENSTLANVGEGSSTTIVRSVTNSTSSENTENEIVNGGDTNEIVCVEDNTNGLGEQTGSMQVCSACGNILPANKPSIAENEEVKVDKPIAVVKPFLRRAAAQPINLNTASTAETNDSGGRLLQPGRNRGWYMHHVYVSRGRSSHADGMRQHSSQATGTMRRVREHATRRRRIRIYEYHYGERAERNTANGSLDRQEDPLPGRNSREMFHFLARLYGIARRDEPSANLFRRETDS